MRAFWTTWQRQSGRHPSVLVLTLVGLLGLGLGPLLVAAGMALVGQLVAGIAVAPLALALYLCLLTDGSWPDDDDGGDGGERPPDTPGEPGGGSEWERFEREFWAHVDRHLPVA
jgi:hypothetical protein